MPMTKKQKKVKYEKKATLFVADDSVDDEDGGSEVADPDEDDDHLYELIRGVPTVVINCLETTDDYIPVPQYTNRESNVVVKLKPATTLVPKFTVSLPIKASCSSSSCKYLPRESKNTDEKEFDQSKRNKNKNGVRGCFNFDSDNNSVNDEKTVSDEKDEKLETDRFVQKGGKRAKTDRFGQKAGGKDMDLEQRALNAEKKLEKLEKLNSSMKTAIRRIVRTERDIKTSLAILTDANCSLPIVRRAREDELGEPQTDEDTYMRKWSSTAFNATPEDEWLVIKVPKANRSHFMCDFCDGDELDNYEWLEGGFKQ